MEHKIIVAGIGPGSKAYVLPEALCAIDKAKVLVGGKRALDGFAKEGQKQIVIGGKLDFVIKQIEENLTYSDVVVMVSGDPGFHSMLVRLKQDFADEQIKVIPGISSLQLAFARINRPWQDAELLSMHGKEQTSENLRYRQGRSIGLLTDTINTPAVIAAKLLSADWPKEARAFVCANLSYENEQIDSFSLENMKEANTYNNCVVVVIG